MKEYTGAVAIMVIVSVLLVSITGYFLFFTGGDAEIETIELESTEWEISNEPLEEDGVLLDGYTTREGEHLAIHAQSEQDTITAVEIEENAATFIASSEEEHAESTATAIIWDGGESIEEIRYELDGETTMSTEPCRCVFADYLIESE